MKENILNILRWVAVAVCTITCMVLIMAEPVTEDVSTKQWMTIFVCMKAGAVISGAMAFGLAGKIEDIIRTFSGNAEEQQ